MNDKVASLNLLALSFSYPPSALPRAVQVGRLLKYLNFSTVLICADHKEKDVREDTALLEESERSLKKCFRVPFAPSSWRALAGRVAYRFDLPVINKIPDQFTPWKQAVTRTVDSDLKAGGYVPDVIVTFGSPMSDHLIGLELKNTYNVPWLAHFSDPWVDNPFAGKDWLTKAINRKLEREVIAAVDRALFTSIETADLVMGKYPEGWRSKARIVPHAFEPELFSENHTTDRSKIVIRYLGDFYGPRSPMSLLRALRSLLATNPKSLLNVEFETIGTIGDLRLRDLELGTFPPGLVTIKPPVSYLASLELMMASDGLLVIDAPADSSVFLPSKLIDYIGADRPILGITPPGTASVLIRELGGWIADPSNPEAVARRVEEFLTFLRLRSGESGWGKPSIRSRFEAQSVAGEFENIVREIAAESLQKSKNT